MSTSFEIPEVDLLTTGTVGPVGQRVFFIQVRQAEQVVSLRLEKAQVAALIVHLGVVMADLPPPDKLPTELDLIEPVVAEWVVGSLGVTYDEEADRVILVAEELVDEDEEPARAVIRATREQVAAFSLHGAAVVEAGRPPCPLCGQPLDPEGHVCIRLNGHRQIR
ncbi:MAG TPA: DUF3090 family protein [Acidimicrobiales bacterium]|jgi:uncharacterized repeat protein (TIGR03847 family)